MLSAFSTWPHAKQSPRIGRLKNPLLARSCLGGSGRSAGPVSALRSAGLMSWSSYSHHTSADAGRHPRGSVVNRALSKWKSLCSCGPQVAPLMEWLCHALCCDCLYDKALEEGWTAVNARPNKECLPSRHKQGCVEGAYQQGLAWQDLSCRCWCVRPGSWFLARSRVLESSGKRR